MIRLTTASATSLKDLLAYFRQTVDGGFPFIQTLDERLNELRGQLTEQEGRPKEFMDQLHAWLQSPFKETYNAKNINALRRAILVPKELDNMDGNVRCKACRVPIKEGELITLFYAEGGLYDVLCTGCNPGGIGRCVHCQRETVDVNKEFGAIIKAKAKQCACRQPGYIPTPVFKQFDDAPKRGPRLAQPAPAVPPPATGRRQGMTTVGRWPPPPPNFINGDNDPVPADAETWAPAAAPEVAEPTPFPEPDRFQGVARGAHPLDLATELRDERERAMQQAREAQTLLNQRAHRLGWETPIRFAATDGGDMALDLETTGENDAQPGIATDEAEDRDEDGPF